MNQDTYKQYVEKIDNAKSIEELENLRITIRDYKKLCTDEKYYLAQRIRKAMRKLK